jgi:hypothetical protein
MIVEALLEAGISIFKNATEEVALEGIRKVTGLDLSKKRELNKSDIATIRRNEVALAKEMELIYMDKQNARNMTIELSKSDSWLLKNTGSLIGIFTVVSSFILFVLLLNGTLSIENSTVAIIVGFVGGYVSQILSFYYGSSKTEADKDKK